jgi:type IV pilus assembly protein PilZ
MAFSFPKSPRGSQSRIELPEHSPPSGVLRVSRVSVVPLGSGRDSRHPASDKRASARLPVNLDVEFVNRVGEWESPRTGTCRNLSVGGMFIETSAPLPFDSRIAVYLKVEGAPGPIGLHANVRWTNGAGMGIQLHALGSREMSTILRLLHPSGMLTF